MVGQSERLPGIRRNVSREGREMDRESDACHERNLHRSSSVQSAVAALTLYSRSQYAIHCAVSFSCTEFCLRRASSAPKSTWSSGWSWLKHENT